MGLNLAVAACVVRILHDDWSIRLGENISEQALKHLAAVLLDLRFFKNTSDLGIVIDTKPLKPAV